jgi:hypothetical protein
MNNHEFTRILTNPERSSFEDQERCFRHGVVETVDVGFVAKLNGNALHLLNWCSIVSIFGC